MDGMAHSILARLGGDLNWWLDQRDELTGTGVLAPHGLLDPRQVRHLVDTTAELRAHGFDPRWLDDALQAYAIEAEVAEGVLQLEPVSTSLRADTDLFALPRIEPEGDGPYFDLLDALQAARIRKLNATHHYANPCTVEEMQDELELLEQDRYFSAESIHAFDAISEILDWNPAEWDDTGSSA